jgi:hypothetical protein
VVTLQSRDPGARALGVLSREGRAREALPERRIERVEVIEHEQDRKSVV